MRHVIALDGPSGAGKSTVARKLASLMGFDYLDTGALYRGVALGLRHKGVEPDAADGALREAINNITVTFREGRVYLDGEDVSVDIRTPQMGHYSSVYSALGPVREALLPIQREAAQHNDLVAEGRDMTTVVFPQAWRKLYLDASVESRAMRRYLQLRGGGDMSVTMQIATSDVVERDRRDSSRDLAPLRRADDAHYIDSSNMTLQQTIDAALDFIRKGGHK